MNIVQSLNNATKEPEAQSSPVASSPGQLRSKPTVVCQECKRLKQKCDRKRPCGNCVKRLAGEKCQYSSGVVDKVDLHSVNERLLEVEIVLNALSSGVPLDFKPLKLDHPPAAQGALKRIADYTAALANGSYIPSQPSSSKHQHQHESRVASESEDFFSSGLSDSIKDYIQVLADSEGISLDGGPSSKVAQSGPSTSFPAANVASFLKSKSQSKSQSGVRPNLDSFLHSQVHRQDPRPLLPPLSIYYGPARSVPGSSNVHHSTDFVPSHTGFANTESAPISYESMSPTEAPLSLATLPAVTRELLKLLPPTATSGRYLKAAQDALTSWPVEMGLPAGTATWPEELRQRMGEGSLHPLGWDAFHKRSKRLFSIVDPSKSTSFSASKPKERKPSATDAASPAPGQVKEKSRSSGKARAVLPPNTDRERHPSTLGIRFRRPPPTPTPTPTPNSPLPTSQDPVSTSVRGTGKQRSKDSASSDENLTFFALICALMAVGASNEPATRGITPTTDLSAFFYALSQQALNLWLETGEPSPPGRGPSDEMRKEARADYLRACIVGLRYLLGDTILPLASSLGAKDGENPNRQAALSLIGKMVNALRGWRFGAGLYTLPSTASNSESRTRGMPSNASKDQQMEGASGKAKEAGVVDESDIDQLIEEIWKREAEEARKRVFWDVLYYDFFVADSFGESPLIPASHYSSPLPSATPAFDAVYHPQNHSDVVMTAKANEESLPKKDVDRRHEVEAERLRLERLYLVSRAQLTQLAFMTKKGILGCCGYTFDDALSLESDVNRWINDVPIELLLAFKHGIIGTSSELISMGSLVLSAEDDDLNLPDDGTLATSKASKREKFGGTAYRKPREEDGNERLKSLKMAVDDDEDEEWEGSSVGPTASPAGSTTRILGCELALMVQLLLYKIYSPLAPQLAIDKHPTNSPSPSAVSALERIVKASQAIIRISKIFYELSKLPDSKPFVKHPLLSMCSLEKIIFDALLVCSRICFGIPSGDMGSYTAGMKRYDPGSTEVMQSIGIGLDLLESPDIMSRYPGKGTQPNSHFVGASAAKELIVVLRKKWGSTMTSFSSQARLKRPRSVMEETRASTSYQQDTLYPPASFPNTAFPSSEPYGGLSWQPESAPSYIGGTPMAMANPMPHPQPAPFPWYNPHHSPHHEEGHPNTMGWNPGYSTDAPTEFM